MYSKSALFILIAIAVKKKKIKKQCRKRKRTWSKNIFLKREKLGQKNLLKELEYNSQIDFKNYVRMEKHVFDELLCKVTPFIEKKDTLMRKAIPAYHRLSLTLRFLASGNSFEDLKFLTAISPQRIGHIVMETCEAIIRVLKEYIKLPDCETEWKILAESFNQRWNFPHCIGAIDGKHISITKPPGTGSQFFNYKKHFSIILMAIVDANCEFIMIEVGSNGRCSDAGVFSNTNFFSKLTQSSLNIPAPESIPNFSTEMPYVFVADDAFPLMPNIMKPFSHRSMDKKEMIYNYRLSRARGTVEMTFGQLTSKFRILLKPINLAPEKATTITLACCYLHNYLRRKKDVVYASSASTENIDTNPLTPLKSTTTRNVCNNVKDVRQNFCEYFNTTGEVSWQNNVYEKLVNP